MLALQSSEEEIYQMIETYSETIRLGCADTRTPEQKQALADLVYRLMDEYPTIKEVIGHRDASPDKNDDGKISKNEWIKQCPCFDVKSDFPMAVCTASKI